MIRNWLGVLQNYGYRLSAYWFPYKTTDDEGKAIFAEGTSFEEVMNNYNFDRDLRFLMFA